MEFECGGWKVMEKLCSWYKLTKAVYLVAKIKQDESLKKWSKSKLLKATA